MFATYFIPQENAPRLRKKLDALARKAVKLGCAAIIYTMVKTFTRPHGDSERAAEGEVIIFEALTIKGEAPGLNGWTFAATLDHVVLPSGEGVNLLRSHSEDALPERFRTATPDNCDHCGTNRRRKATFVVRNEAGEWKQVGRQCLKDFLGYHKDPGAIARYAALLLSLDVLMESESGGEGGGYVESTYDLRTFLAWTVQRIEDEGWMSRSKARELEEEEGRAITPTADAVLCYLSAKTEEERKRWKIPPPTDKSYEEVDEALAWLEEQDSVGNDYIHNCQVISELGCVTWRMAGYAASIVSSHRRAKNRQLRREILVADGTAHIGTEGKRGEFCLTLLAVIDCESFYGTSYLHKFADPDGNAVTWFASNPAVVPEGAAGHGNGGWGKARMVNSASYRVKATVKEHGDYQGQPQTQVTRVAVQPLTKPKKKRKARKKKVKVA